MISICGHRHVFADACGARPLIKSGIDVRVRGAIGPREADAIAAGCTNRGCLYRLSWAAASRQLPASRVANWRRLGGNASCALAMRNQNTTMTAAANTPHTITNALMICFSSETDIASAARDQTDIANDPGLGDGRGRHSHESALRSG